MKPRHHKHEITASQTRNHKITAMTKHRANVRLDSHAEPTTLTGIFVLILQRGPRLSPNGGPLGTTLLRHALRDRLQGVLNLAPMMPRDSSLSGISMPNHRRKSIPFSCRRVHTNKYFLNLGNLNRIWIILTLFRLIWHKRNSV